MRRFESWMRSKLVSCFLCVVALASVGLGLLNWIKGGCMRKEEGIGLQRYFHCLIRISLDDSIAAPPTVCTYPAPS